MGLNVKSFAQLVQDQAAAIQTKSSKLIDFLVGAVLRALAESNAAIALWLQGLVLYILTVTRLSTSQGPDVDSFVNDWGVTRLGATISVGSVTYSRFTPSGPALIPVGAQVQTADTSQNFLVVADDTNSAFDPIQNGYIVPDGVATMTVPVQAVTGSQSGNVAAGTVTIMYDAIVGIDQVTNALAFSGGSNAETDAALRTRFQLFIASLREGTVAAITFAITSLQLGLQCTIIENKTPDGVTTPGFLWITVDDGTGAPPASILAAAAAAVSNVRAAGIMWGCFAPTVLPASIAITLTTSPGYDHNTLVAAVAAQITAYVNTLPLGASLPFLRLAQVVMNVSPGIASISMIMNGSSLDIICAPNNVIKLTTLTVV